MRVFELSAKNFIVFAICLALAGLPGGMSGQEGPSLLDDLLLPYHHQRGSTQHIRHVRSMQNPKYNNTYETYRVNVTDQLQPVATTRYFVSDVPGTLYYYNKVKAYGHHTTVTNPLRSFSVLEPRDVGGCKKNISETVENSARQRNCLVTQNGGFFNTKYGSCIGNIVSDSRLVQDSGGVQNANFGITKNGSIVVGYLSSEDIADLNFKQLVGGAIWLVRNGESYVEEAYECESSDVEETGTLRTFIDVQSARTAIGHDSVGRIVLVNIEGQTRSRGVNLNQFAKLLIEEFHVINAINLDGGGSATLVLDGILANYPSDHCKSDPEWRCARAVSTIVCVHELDCEPGCVHGECVDGRCSCHENYQGETCNELHCGERNCSMHGICTPDGCDCAPGWHGKDCTGPCGLGYFGKDCMQACLCRNNGSCDSVNGSCSCLPGFGGALCEKRCPLGTYGQNCEYRCHCSETCFCDPTDGVCSTVTDPELKDDTTIEVAQCLVNKELKAEMQKQNAEDFLMYRWVAVLCSTIGALVLSLLFNVYMLLIKFDCMGDYCRHGDRFERARYIPLKESLGVSLNSRSPEDLDQSLELCSDSDVESVDFGSSKASGRWGSTGGQRTRPFSMDDRRKRRTERNISMPSLKNFVKNFKKSQNSKEGYQKLIAPTDTIEYEETSLLEAR